jgi:hypothetical protein
MSEEDIDFSLKSELEIYTAGEMRQLQEITQQTLDHMKKLLANTSSITGIQSIQRIPENHKLTLELSIKQAEEDLVVIASAMEERKVKIGADAFAKELSAPHDNTRRLAQSEDDDDFADLG